jgi:hypothetical protein
MTLVGWGCLLVGKREGKRPLGRRRRKWVDNYKMDLREIGWGGVGWIGLVQVKDQCMALCERGNELSESINS